MLYWYGGITLVCRLSSPVCFAPLGLTFKARRRKCIVWLLLVFSRFAEPPCLICSCLMSRLFRVDGESEKPEHQLLQPASPVSLQQPSHGGRTPQPMTPTPAALSLSSSIVESFMLWKDGPDPLSDFSLWLRRIKKASSRG